MATTVTYSQNVVSITGIATNSWLWSTTFPGNLPGILVHSIVCYSAAADTFVLRDGSLTGPIWFKVVTAGAASATYLIGGVLLRPVLTIGDQTANANSIYTILYSKP